MDSTCLVVLLDIAYHLPGSLAYLIKIVVTNVKGGFGHYTEWGSYLPDGEVDPNKVYTQADSLLAKYQQNGVPEANIHHTKICINVLNSILKLSEISWTLTYLVLASIGIFKQLAFNSHWQIPAYLI